MKSYFIPITELGLVEFLSSGFIGISESKVDYSDIHTRLWPNTVITKCIEDSPLPICCEIEPKGRAYLLPAQIGSKKIQIFRLKSPYTINDVKKIYFPSESSLNEFISKYHYMSDLNFNDLPLVVNDSLIDSEGFTSGDIGDHLDLVEAKKFKNDNDLEKIELKLHSRSLVAYTYAVHKHLKINISEVVPIISKTSDIEDGLHKLSDLLDIPPPPEGLGLIFEKYWNLCRTNIIDSRSDQMEIVESLIKHLRLRKDGGGEMTKSISFLEKVANVFMGMEPHPQLDEKSPEKAFQHGFYVSLMAKSPIEFTGLRNRFRFSQKVEVIAKYLFILRVHFNQLTEDFFSSFGTTKSTWASAILSSYQSSQANLKLNTKKNNEDLETLCDVIINDKTVGTVKKEITPEEQLVVSTLRTFAVEPFRDSETGDIAVRKYVQSKPIVVTLKIFKSTSNNQVNEVYIQHKTSAKHSILAKAKTRLSLLRLASYQGVALGVNDDGNLILTRLQMVDTMDRDELWHHVEQVAEGGALMEELVLAS